MVGNFGFQKKGTMRVRALPLARALARRGHEVTMLLPSHDDPERAGSVCEDAGVVVEDLPWRGPAAVAMPQTVACIARRCAELRPDVLHAFKPISYAGFAAWFTLLRRPSGAGRPRVVVDADDWEGTGGWATFDRRPFPVRKLVDLQERWTLAHADAVTVASRALQAKVAELGIPAERVHYLPNGAELTFEPDTEARASLRAALGLGDAPVVLLYTRFFEYPLRLVAETIRRVHGEVPSARLLVVGKGFWGEEERLARMLVDAGLGSVARFAGWAAKEELAACFAAADVALYPLSDTLLNRTKCPVKLVDLLAAGVPVVASAVGQAAEYIENGKSGYLVAPEDAEAFAKRVVALLGDAALRERIGAGALARIRREFLWDDLAATAERSYAGAKAVAEAGTVA